MSRGRPAVLEYHSTEHSGVPPHTNKHIHLRFDHRIKPLWFPTWSVRSRLSPWLVSARQHTAVGDEDDRCAIRPHIRRGRGNELRRPDARAAAGGHRTHVRARGTLPTESRTRHGIVGAGHGKWRTRTRAQRGGRAGSTARAGTAAPAMPPARVRAEERQHRRRDGRRRDGNEVAAGALPHERREGGGRRRERRRGRRGLRRRRGRRRRRRQRRQPLRTLNIVQFTRPKRLRPRL